MKLRALVLVLALAACGPQAEKAGEAPADAEATDPFNLNIEIGRYGVMLDQVETLTAERSGAAEAEVTEPRELARRLREAVWELNLERSQLCAKGLFTEVACQPAYEPVWISEPAAAEPTLEQISQRSADLREEVMRLWDAVCEDARTRVADEQERMYVCPME